MPDQQLLLDAFAVVRGTWDDLVALQPDIISAGGALDVHELDELDRRVAAHQEAVDTLVEALQTASVETRSAFPTPGT